MKIPGVLNYVYYMGKPARIKHSEIEKIRRFLFEFKSVEVVENSMPVNSHVRVKQGLMMDYHGILLEVRGKKASVRIDSMGLQLTAFFDKSNLELLEGKKT